MSKQRNLNPQKPKGSGDSQTTLISPIAGQVILTLISAFAILILLKLPRHQENWWSRVSKYYEEIPQQKKNMGEEQRMQSRHGGNYMIPKIIAQNLKPDDIFLLPPKEYVQKNEQNPNNWSNPYVFYYMNSEVKTCAFTNETLRPQATKALIYDKKGGIQLVELKNDSIRNQIITLYQAK